TSTGAVTTEASAEGIRYIDIDQALYTGRINGTYEIQSSKLNYDLEITSSTLNNGDQKFDLKLTFNPNDFNLEFSVAVDPSIPTTLIPTHVNAKVLYWTGSEWAIIVQQEETNDPPVTVAVDGQTRVGTGSYPVWMHDGNQNPYDYRVMVTGFVYPDGTVKAAHLDNGVYTDGNYTATIHVIDGHVASGSTLGGAYYTTAGGVGTQKGTITVHVTAETYSVTFNANGGSINGSGIITEDNLYLVPNLDEYEPVRENYIFRGWVNERDLKTGEVLISDATFVAKWEPIQSITGTIYVDGLYEHNGVQSEVRSTCLPDQVTVYLQRNDGTNVFDITNKVVTVDWGNAIQKHGIASYEFTGLDYLAAGHYQIVVRETNYTSSYVNSLSTSLGAFSDDNSAVFANNQATSTYVNAMLSFAPDTFDQQIVVDSSDISSGYRPESVRVHMLYKEQGTQDEFNRINEHTVAPYGIEIVLNDQATVTASQTGLWRRSWNENHLFDYKAELIKVGVNDFNADTAPFTVSYGNVAFWNGTGSSGPLNVKLTPKTYDIVYDYGYNVADLVVEDAHTWSRETALSTVEPTRNGYVFMGWYDNEACQG
ncbi:MAG: InlB B-repeat-containing protein, partial [Firmicutes bacterium]|nr:InlB B-repeat-containing protein [Bacillota bacterium]